MVDATFRSPPQFEHDPEKWIAVLGKDHVPSIS
jgi:hypothetical protein